MFKQKPAYMTITTPDGYDLYLGMHSLCTDRPHPHPLAWVTRKAQKYANAFKSCTVTVSAAGVETVITPNNDPAKITGVDMIALGLHIQTIEDADPYEIPDFYNDIGAMSYNDETWETSFNFSTCFAWYRDMLDNDPAVFTDELKYFIDLYDDGDPAKEWRITLLNAVKDYAEMRL